MTTPSSRPPTGSGRNPHAPQIQLASSIEVAAGAAVHVPVTITHRGRSRATLRLTVLGLDATWAPEPLVLGPLESGESVEVTLTLVPERGALGAKYPFVIAVEATPERGAAGPVIGSTEATLVVDSAERISMTMDPPTPSAVFSRKIRLDITNPGITDREFTLVPSSPVGATVRLSRDRVAVPARSTTSVGGKVRIRRPSIFGTGNVHTFGVSAQGQGAPEYLEASIRAKALVGSGARGIIGLVLVVALWAALAIVFIPKISDAFKPKTLTSAPQTVTVDGPVAGDGSSSSESGAGDGSGDGGTGDGGAGDGGPGGQGGDGSGQPGSGSGGGYQLTGAISGPGADRASVTLAPVRLSSLGSQDVSTTPDASEQTVSALRAQTDGAIGKIPGSMVEAISNHTRATTITTGPEGEFEFGAIHSPGYYLLTIANKGFQTQKFLINSTDLASPEPLKIELAPGAGALSGSVSDAAGRPLGAATITVSDGTNTLQTSSVSTTAHQGTPGTWSIDSLSTPGTYLVTASLPGFGATSSLVTLGPSEKASADLSLVSGEGTITGIVTGLDNLGEEGGLGGITVSATDGEVTRTATTVTSADLRGTFILPNMPVPGNYTVTISGDGFLSQTQTVTLPKGTSTVSLTSTLSRSDSSVTGVVTGTDADGNDEGGLVGVGLTLTSSQMTLKTMTTSGDAPGSFRFTGVPPGTYVLTADQYGRTPASATIELAAAESRAVDLTLKDNIGEALPATAHIRGQVVDSRTGGPLTCDRTPTPISAADCVATASITTKPSATDPGQGPITFTSTSTAALNFVYTVPSLDDPQHRGLTPGLYTVTVSAPGYETVTANVQVAQGQTVAAPQVSLPALGIISGTLTARVGTPNAQTCVIAVPTDVTVPSPQPVDCTPANDGATCSVPAMGTFPCGLTSMGGPGEPAAGTYQVRGLQHGRYQMVVVPQDPQYRYVVGSPPIVDVPVGADAQFNAVLDRMGQIQLTVLSADRKTGVLTPASGAEVTVALSGGGPAQSVGQTDSGGHLTVIGLQGTYLVAATKDGTTATATSDTVGLNQTVGMTLVLAAPVGPLVGRVTTTGTASTPVALASARVTISGVVGYERGEARRGSITVTTDSNGCYAIVPDGYTGDPADLVSADCPDGVEANDTSGPVTIVHVASVKNDSTGQDTTLTTDRIQIAVQATAFTETYPVTDTTITDTGATAPVRVIPATNVVPLPIKVGQLRLQVEGPSTGFNAPDLSTANIVVTNKPGLAGGVTIQAASTTAEPVATEPVSTALSFVDTLHTVPSGAPAVAIPGKYPFTVSLDGFVTKDFVLVCEFGGLECSLTDGSGHPITDGAGDPSLTAVLPQLPTMSVDVKAPVIAGVTPNWNTALINVVSGPPGLTNLSLVTDATDPQLAHVSFNGDYAPLVAANSKYQFTVQADWYGTTGGTATCGADYTASCHVTITLKTLPLLTGSTATLSSLTTPSGTALSRADIQAVVTPNKQPAITAAVSASGTVSWVDPSPGVKPGQVVPGDYTITYSKPGFETATATLSCLDGDSTCTQSPAAVTLKMLPVPDVTVTIPLATGASSVNMANAKATITDPTNSPIKLGFNTASVSGGQATVTLQWDATPDQPFVGIVPANTYDVTVTIPGYQPLTIDDIDCTTVGETCTAAGTAELYPQPTTDVTILPNASFGMTATPTGPTPRPPAVTITTSVDGTVHWQQPDYPAGVVAPGTYTLTVTPYPSGGYEMYVNGSPTNSNHTATFTCSQTACEFPDITLVAPTNLHVQVQDASGAAAGSAKITLERASTTSQVVNATTGAADFHALTTGGIATQADGSTADQSYTLDIKAAGFEFASVSSDTTTTTGVPRVQCVNGSRTINAFRLIPGGTTTCTVTLQRMGAVTGTVTWLKEDLTGLIRGTQALVTAPDVTAQLLGDDGTPTGTSFDATFSTTSGQQTSHFTIAGTVNDGEEGLSPGTWLVTVSGADGFAPYSGIVTINADYSMSQAATAVGGYNPIPVTSGSAQILLTATPVDFDVHLQAGSSAADILPNATVTLHDQFLGSVSCTIDNGALVPTSACTLTGTDASATDKYVTFTDVPPGSYTLSVTFTQTDTYQNIATTNPIAIAPGDDDAHYEQPLAAKASSVTVAFTDTTGAAIQAFGDGGATVKMQPYGSVATADPSKDFWGADLSKTAVTTGTVTFTDVPNGTYQFAFSAPGYQSTTNPSKLVIVNFAASPTYVVPNYQVSPSTRTVSLTLTEQGETAAVNLSGWQVVLTPKGASPHQPANSTYTQAVNSTSAITLNAVPTGTWTVQVQHLAGSTADRIPIDVIGDLVVADGAATLPKTMELARVAVPITVTFDDGDCIVAPADDTTFTVNVTKDSVTQPVSMTVDDGEATGSVLLPPGDYTWVPDFGSMGWTASGDEFSVTSDDDDGTAVAPTGGTSDQASASTREVSLTFDLTGTATAADVDARITASCTADSSASHSVVLDSATGSLDLPDSTWEFTIEGTHNGYPIYLPSQEITTSSALHSVTFTGYQLQPQVVQAAVPGLPASTTVDADVSLTEGTDTTPFWSTDEDHQASVDADGWTSTVTPIVAAGSYTLHADTGTDANFADGTSSSTTVGTTTTGITSVTATLPYKKAAATITVMNADGSAPVTNAAVTVSVLGLTGATCTTITSEAGKISCAGLAPSTTYGITASRVTSNIAHSGYATVSTGAAGEVAAGPSVNLSETNAVLVSVVDDDEPVSGATVSLYTAGGTTPAKTGTTDAQGNVLISGLTNNTSYTVVASTADNSGSGTTTVTAKNASLETASIDFDGNISASVKVVDSDDNSAVISDAEVRVYADSAKHHLLASGPTGTDGVFAFAAPAGSVWIHVEADDYVNGDVSGLTVASSTTWPHTIKLTAET